MAVPAASIAKPVPLGAPSRNAPDAQPRPAPASGPRRTDGRPAENRPPRDRPRDPGAGETRRHCRGRPTANALPSTPCVTASAQSGSRPSNRRRVSATSRQCRARARPRLRSSHRVSGGAPAWSPDGRTLLVAGLPEPQPVYNGNPLRIDARGSAAVCDDARISTLARPGTAARP